MINTVEAQCERCRKTYQFFFGDLDINVQVRFFLEMIKTKQINLLKWENFQKFYFDYMKKNVDKNLDEADEKVILTIKELYDEIYNFFKENEIEMLQKNILLNFSLSVVPVYKKEFFFNEEKAEISHMQHLTLEFLGKEPYTRSLLGYDILDVNPETKKILCPYDGQYLMKELN
ncbi:hypothetical protein [Mycoplasma buteonis]|uniref:hypothetical protein n=1 Tax=Mycoplasma buteonis TaxID=171280 RepID=UPI00055FA3EA|nr:hypothetical protein [Mycoplasma buteonis]